MNLILAYYHLRDDWVDEKKIGGFLGTCALRRRVKKAVKKYPRQSHAIQKELKALARCEQDGIMGIDQPAGCFGRLMAELMVWKRISGKRRCGRLDSFLGNLSISWMLTTIWRRI